MHVFYMVISELMNLIKEKIIFYYLLMHNDNNVTSPFQSRDGHANSLKRLSKTKAITKEVKPSKELVRSGIDQEPMLSM